MILVRERIVDAISLKITKLGGLPKTYAAAQICEAGGVRYRLGAHVGPMLLAAHAMQLAAALPGIWYASELTEFDGWRRIPGKASSSPRTARCILSDAIGCGVNPKAGQPSRRIAARARDMSAVALDGSRTGNGTGLVVRRSAYPLRLSSRVCWR